MANLAQRDQVFISYSHKDKKLFDQLQTSLKPLVRGKKISVWDDTKIKSGDAWREQIQAAIASAKVAVLLVSPDFLASDFIAEHELPPLLEAAKKEGLKILWIAARFSMYEETEIVRYQGVNDPARPLASISGANREKELVRICKEIKLAVLGAGEQEAVFVNVSDSTEAALTPSQLPEVYLPARESRQELPENTEGKVQTFAVKEKRISILNRLEKTVSNPYYKSDLKALEDLWDITQVLGPETIMIVTGSNVVCELLDRPVAEIIRDEIDRQGDISIGRRGLVIGDLWWFNDPSLHSHHVISLGGPSINPLTKEITSQGNISGYSPSVFKSVIDGPVLRVALWGDKAAQTRASAEFYIQDPEGLTYLLNLSWNR